MDRPHRSSTCSLLLAAMILAATPDRGADPSDKTPPPDRVRSHHGDGLDGTSGPASATAEGVRRLDREIRRIDRELRDAKGASASTLQRRREALVFERAPVVQRSLRRRSSARGPAPQATAVPCTARRPRWVPPKPKTTHLRDDESRRFIVVKIVQPSRVRLRNDRLVDLDDRLDLSALDSLLAAHPRIVVQRHFSRPELQLAQEREAALRATCVELGDLDLYYRLDLKNAADIDPAKLIDELNALDVVELAFATPLLQRYRDRTHPDLRRLPPNRVACSPGTSPADYESEQTHLDPAPTGLDAEWAWTLPGGRGPGVRYIDLEVNWNLDHHDLPAPFIRLPSGYSSPGASCNSGTCSFNGEAQHGTSVLGVVSSLNNGVGTTGIASDAQYGIANVRHYDEYDFPDIAETINTAAANLGSGDVLLIEVSGPGPSSGGSTACTNPNSQFDQVPMEYWQDNFDAIQNAVAAGITVVEAAANGEADLDDPLYGNRFNPGLRDSGAILVGAGSPFTHAPECFTAYGSRIDVQGFGGAIVTTGGGSCYPDDTSCSVVADCEHDDLYTGGFGGTSGASPMIVGAAAILQSVSETNYSRTLTPAQIRDYLKINGTPQPAPATHWIGPLPNLRGLVRADLVPRYAPGWDFPLVPRATTGATCGNVTLPASLPGNVTGTYLNFIGENVGVYETGPFSALVYLDDALVQSALWLAPVTPGQTPCAVDRAPIHVRGGRHTLRVAWDGYAEVPEWEESNNGYAHQFVWSPLVLANDVPVVRATPPDRDTTGIVYYNSDGFEFRIPTGFTGWWGAVAMLPAQAGSNFDVRLHDDYTGSEAGFGPLVEWSAWSGGQSDFVLVNGNVVGSGTTHWASLLQGADTPDYGNATVEYDAGPTLPALGTHGPYALGAGEVLDVLELYFGPGDTGLYYDFRLDNQGAADLGFSLYDASLATTNKSGYVTNGFADTFGGGGDESFSVYVANQGYYALVVWKYDSEDLPLSSPYEVSVALTPPNLAPTAPGGWTGPVVARDTTGCNGIDCSVSPTLPGGGATYFNWHGTNIGVNPMQGTFRTSVSLDDVERTTVDLSGPIDPDDDVFGADLGPFAVGGGRHTLGVRIDSLDAIEETSETDNTAYRQFVWSPRALTDGVTWYGSAPPDRDTAGATFPNSDGYSWSTGWWSAVALLPLNDIVNYDLNLHGDYAGSQTGFAVPLQASFEPAGSVDFVVVNANHVSVPLYSTWYGAVVQGSGVPQSAGYVLQQRNNLTVGAPVPGTLGPRTLPAGQLIDVFEIYFDSTDVGKSFVFRLDNVSGGMDLAMALYDGSQPHFAKRNYVAASNDGGPGEDEAFIATAFSVGYNAIVVWKTGLSGLEGGASYSITSQAVQPFRIGPGSLRVDRDAPGYLRLSWERDCNAVPATNYNIYTGDLTGLRIGIYDYGAAPPVCNAGTDLEEVVPMPRDSVFFVVVPNDDVSEGSYGTDSGGAERPPAAEPCLGPQQAAPGCVL